MGNLVIGIIVAVVALVVLFIPSKLISTNGGGKIKTMLGSALFVLSLVIAGFGAFSYNDAGYCQHVRTVAGTESSVCKTGWFFLGWGSSTEWPHFITIAHTADATGESSFTAFQGSISSPYPVRLADNWNGDVTQTTRFGIPQDSEQFIKMARDFRSPERLINTTLRPAVTSSLDSVANLFSMEEYYAGGKRDQFKTEFRDAVIKGRAQVRQVSTTAAALPQARSRVAASELEAAQDTSDVGDTSIRRTIMEKVLLNGQEVREQHGYVAYGVTVSSAILENLDPDDRFGS